jgi:uncharacterized membrane protein YjjP (DUF1212 family)
MIEIEELIDIALKAGEILLKSGAEIYRVEDTITRICRGYDMQCESFVLPTGIFITVNGKTGESASSVKRIKQRTVDLNRIELVNTFSRNIQNARLPYENAISILSDIENTGRYNEAITIITAGVSAFVFTLLFKGNIQEGIAAFFISMIINGIKDKIGGLGFFQFFEYFVSGVIAGALSFLSIVLFPGLNVYRLVIGSIIILLPGVAITR